MTVIKYLLEYMLLANNIFFSVEEKMTEELMKESMNALKEFAKHKNSYRNMTDNLKYENIIFFGKLYSETLDIIKNDVEFYICCLNKKATLNFRNESFQDMDNKSVFSSDEILFEFNNKKLEFTAGGSHWILE